MLSHITYINAKDLFNSVVVIIPSVRVIFNLSLSRFSIG